MEEIIGRDAVQKERWGIKGCGYIGKVVSYPGGRYEEVGRVYLDLATPHCMLVVGKRGTGKSYTLGVIAEAFQMLEEDVRSKISMIIVDTLGVFHSLKVPNNVPDEVAMLEKHGLKPFGLEDNVRVFVPEIAKALAKRYGANMYSDAKLCIPLASVNAYDWIKLLGIEPQSDEGIVLMKLYADEHPLKFEDLYDGLSRLQTRFDQAVAYLEEVFRIFENTGLFSNGYVGDYSVITGGKISVLDMTGLGNVGGYDLRALVVGCIARDLLRKRMLYSTLQMQETAGLTTAPKEDFPLVYMMIDEAHLFVPSDASAISTAPLIDWVKLGRHPGLSLILATQEPSALHTSAIRQADIIIAHNVTSYDDIVALKKAKQSYMGDKGVDVMASTMEFRRGLAAIFDDKNRKCIMCKIRPRCTLHTGMDAVAL